MDLIKKEQLYEGKAKKVFATDEDGVVIVDYKDDATAFNGEKKGTIMGKGVVNNKNVKLCIRSARKGRSSHSFYKGAQRP